VPRRRWWLLFAGGAALVVAAVIVAVVALASPESSASRPAAAHGDHAMAQQINLSLASVPDGWKVDASGSGPLSGLLGGGSSSPTTPAQSQQADQTAKTFEQCLGVPPSSDRIFGSAGGTPTAQASSPAFASPTSPPLLEAGSTVEVYATAAPVSADLAEVSEPKFPTCFGQALGQLLAGSAQSGAGSSGVTVGTPQVSTIGVATHDGVQALGVAIDLPLSKAGQQSDLQFGFTLLGGGRTEATLVTFSAPTPFPASLTTSLAQSLQTNIATEGSGTGL